jgi:hypothetical protein
MSSAIDARREPPPLSGHRTVICAKIPIRGRQRDDLPLVAFNFTLLPRHYRAVRQVRPSKNHLAVAIIGPG